jgi:aryl-alcohol dehydrogenase-like predicted oxidoreductase
MQTRAYGTTGLTVSVLGFGAGQIGESQTDEGTVERLLHEVVDLGVTLIDTARGYGLSEERIGRYLSSVRHRLVLSTKGGYGVEGVPDWTGDVITRGVEDALRRLRTDYIDIFHLHSCPRDVLERGEVVVALERAVAAGKVRVAAYSGENDALAWAASCPVFHGLQCSVNLADQAALDAPLPEAVARGVGVIGKRPLANAAWQFESRPHGAYAERYWDRLQVMSLDRAGLSWPQFALRFSAFAPGVTSVIVGTKHIDHLRANAAIVSEGPMQSNMVEAVRHRFRECARFGGGWAGDI